MIVAVETLFLVALLSAFVGLVALLALYSPAVQGSPRLRGSLVGTIVVATAAAAGSYFLYVLTPHEAARQSVYGATARPAFTALTITGERVVAGPQTSRRRL